MTQEDKKLLLKDLCTRLPYGVILETGTHLRSIDTLTQIVSGIGTDKKIENTKYYLRPMSSMTEEEREIYDSMFIEIEGSRCALFPTALIDWLNEHHFDYRGLIEKGLALKAPKRMYKEN